MGQSLSVFGLGYVGTVTAACLASDGHPVIGVDLNPAKVETIEAGCSPIIEPGLSEFVAEGRRSGLLRATENGPLAVAQTKVSFICVGTPGLPNGKLDLSHIERVCAEIGQALREKSSPHLIVIRSTILPGTTESVVIPILEKTSGKKNGKEFGVCVNPEFLREGSAIADFREPAITVIGSADSSHAALLRNLLTPAEGRFFETSFRVAEMVKYVSNAWHATKVAFANEMGTLAKVLEADVDAVTEVFLADTKLNISPAYLRPGFAYGGSCLPKDLRALNYRAREVDLDLPLLQAISESNRDHLKRAIDAVLRSGKRAIGILGLSFKPGTDDLRDSPQVQMVKVLLGEGRQVRIWDENVALGKLIGSNRQYIEQEIPHIGSLLCSAMHDVLRDSELIVIATTQIDKAKLKAHLRPEQSVIDLMNLESHAP